MTQKVLLFVGGYTRPAPYLNSTNAKGIRTYSFDLETGALHFLFEKQGIDNPSYLAINHAHTHLYAISEVWGWQEGVVSAYAINQNTGELTYINKQATLGSISAHLEVDQTDKLLLVANYEDGKGVGEWKLYYEDGKLAQESEFKDSKENGIRKVYSNEGKLISEVSIKNRLIDGILDFGNVL